MWKIVRDWLLPFIATFCGVFLAAYLAHWSELSRENENFDHLLRVLHEDTQESWRQSRQVLATLSTDPRDQDNASAEQQIIRQPSLLLSSLRANPAVLARFHPLTFAELIILIPDIEGGVISYISNQRQLKAIKFALQANETSQELLQELTQNLSVESSETLKKTEYGLRRALFLLQVEQQYRSGFIAQSELERLIKAAEFSL